MARRKAFGTAGGPVRYERAGEKRLVPLKPLSGTEGSDDGVFFVISPYEPYHGRFRILSKEKKSW